ncbi:MAG: urease accessory protein UreF [Alphaproteobacteria bacterium]|nr:urease accessory protein UreF [Alphaproteobacteria bacterium]
MPSAITTMTTIDELLRLLTWLSPGFPTGGFAYSHGLEWSVEAGDISDEAALRDWVADVLSHGAGRSDVILLRHAHRAGPDGLPALCALGVALGFGRERRLETCAQGGAFVRAGTVWGGPRITALADMQVPYPVAVGALAADHGIGADLAAAAYSQAFAVSLVSVGVRLIPLGQTAGVRVIRMLEPKIAEVVEQTKDAGLDDLGGACFRSDIAAMRHETQRTRLFRT